MEKEKKLTEAILSARDGVLDLLPADAGGDELKAHIVQRIDAAVLNVGVGGSVRYPSGDQVDFVEPSQTVLRNPAARERT